MTGKKSEARLKMALRGQMIKEEPEELTDMDTEIKRKKSTSYDRLQINREKSAERQRRKRAQMSEAEKEKERITNAEKARKRRAQRAEGQTKLRTRTDKVNRQNKLSNDSSRFQELRNKDAELKRRKRAEMTEEEKNELRAKWAEVQRKKRAALSEEERKRNRAKWAEEKRRKRALLSKEEKKTINAKKSQRLKVKENETTDQRLRRLISLTGVHVNKNPDRYKIAGAFIKEAFCDIRDMYSEVGKLKNYLKLCVARVAQHTIRFHRRGDERKAGKNEYEFKTFVEITPPIDLNNHTQNQLYACDNDPLFGEQDIKIERKYEMTNENTADDDVNFDDFILFIHDSPSTVEKNTRGNSTAEKIDCTMCSKKFATSLGLVIHQKSHKTRFNEFKCCVCSQIFSTYDSMTDHYLQVHSFQSTITSDEEESSEKCIDEIEERSKHEFDFFYSGKCSICDKTFDKTIFGLGVYSAHIINDHSENKNLLKYFTYICSHCEVSHTTLRLLKTHWITHCLQNWKNENNKDKKIVCENCGMQFENEKSLSSHTNIFHVLQTRVSCEQCESSFSRKKTLKQHIEAVHQGGNTFPCENCEERFESKQLLRQHGINVHSAVKKPFSCSFCEQSFRKRRLLKEHVESIHPLEGQKRFPCENCNQIFRRKEYLKKHKKRGNCVEREKISTPEIETEFACTLCEQIFPKQQFLKEHFELAHPGEEFRPYSCKNCVQAFKRKDTLERHTKNIHLGQKDKTSKSPSKSPSKSKKEKFECTFCGKSFRSKDSFDYHVNTHTGERPYKCRHCDKGFAARSALTMHEGIHEGFSCKICGESFSCYYDLSRHRQITHPDAAKNETKEEVQVLPISNLQLICDLCGKTFASYLCLDAHKRYTHGEKKFVCDICGKAYNRPSSLRKHRYSHDAVQRFGCTLCDKTFVRPDKFYKHRTRTHKNDDEYARIVKLIPDDKSASAMKINQSANVSNMESVNMAQKGLEEHPNAQPINTQASINTYLEHHLPELLDASNVSWEAGNSPDPGDYSPEAEFDHEEIVNDIDVPKNRNTDLKSINIQNKMLHTPSNTKTPNNIRGDSTFDKHAVFGTNSEFRHSNQSSNFIDFSRANVPSVPVTLTVVKELTNISGKKNGKEEEEASTADTDSKKIKTEAPANIIEDGSSASSDETNLDSENDFQTEDTTRKLTKTTVSFPQDPYSPCVVVKLTRLLEHKCVPCKKTIFAISQREIRQHSRSHRSNTMLSAAKHILFKEKTKRKSTPIKGVSKRKPVHINGASKRESIPIHGVFKVKVFDCSYCEQKNFSAISIMSHCLKAHPGQKPIKCPKCPKMFNAVTSYYNHKKKRHNPPKPKKPLDPNAKKEAICELCGKAFYTKQQVYVHKSQQHSGKSFPCTVCSRKFLQKANLANHIKRVHSGSNEGKTHLCEECGKAFFTTSELKIHVNVVHRKIANYKQYKNRGGNTAETHPYPCVVCPHKSVTEKGLQKHLRVHDPAKKYVCGICGWRYSHCNYLMSHKQITHKIFGPRSKKAKATFLAVELGIVSYL